MLLSDNGSGVLLSTAGARLPNRTRAGLCFKTALRLSPSDNMRLMRHLQVCFGNPPHSSYIFLARGENVIIMKTIIYFC